MNRRVTLVSGPPCAGKSTLVVRRMRPGDLVVCLDTLAVEAGSPVAHGHDERYMRPARRRYAQLCDQVAGDPQAQAWVIRSAPGPGDRDTWAVSLHATEVVVVMPPFDVVLRRAQRERDRRTQGVVRGWYDRYAPAECDTEVVR